MDKSDSEKLEMVGLAHAQKPGGGIFADGRKSQNKKI